MLANTLNICSDEELEHAGGNAEDSMLIILMKIKIFIFVIFISS
jgi:hypothetical protein